MKTTSLAVEVRDALERGRRPAAMRVIAHEADVGYEWLVKFAHGHIEEPGLMKVERVRDALSRLGRKSKAA